MIPTAHRLEYFSGYLELGLFDLASNELEAIEGVDRLSADVMAARSALYFAAKKWELLVEVARALARLRPENDQGWIHWAYALRELNRVAEAQAILLEAEPQHGGKCDVLHYNLACYACLLGDRTEARRRLKLASKFNSDWKQTALADSDLKAMWEEIAGSP